MYMRNPGKNVFAAGSRPVASYSYIQNLPASQRVEETIPYKTTNILGYLENFFVSMGGNEKGCPLRNLW
jgi:hypothetical protein